MAEYGEEGMAVSAAKILLSLRSRNLVRWPEWIPPPCDGLLQRPEEEPAKAEVELPPPLPEGWPKRPRLPLRARARGTAWLLSLESPFARLGRPVVAGSGACSREEERAWSRPKVKRESLAARRPEMPPCYGSATGSGPSTSGADRARPRRRPRVSEEAQATVTARTDATMAASSPETPFEYANAAGSGASSSGDEVARSTAKRKARGSSGSVGPSSSDEGCSPPADVNGAGQAAAAAVKVEEQKIKDNCRDEKGHLLFDLNEDINMGW